MLHLAIFIGNAIEKILRGEKTIEFRLTENKIIPYSKIKKGDEILLKESGGLIKGRAVVDNVLFFDHLDGEIIGKLRREYNEEAKTDDKFWQTKSKSRYASVIFLKNPQRFLAPLKDKKKDRRPWAILESDEL